MSSLPLASMKAKHMPSIFACLPLTRQQSFYGFSVGRCACGRRSFSRTRLAGCRSIWLCKRCFNRVLKHIVQFLTPILSKLNRFSEAGEESGFGNRASSITRPIGDFEDPHSKIYPFKIMRGIQPADAENRYLLVPHLFGPGGYWNELDWQQAFKTGMKSVNLPYSGKFAWTQTEMYWGIHHEVMPKNMALSCVQCHDSLKGDKTCNRCHQDSRDVNFKALGYKGDPIVYGGRFKQLPLGRGSGE